MEVESKISDALRHIASFQLSRIAEQSLQEHLPLFGAQAVSIVETKFTGALDSEDPSTVKSCVNFIYGLEVNEARLKYPHKSERELRLLSEKNTKVVIKGIVDREWKNMLSQVKEEESSQLPPSVVPLDSPPYQVRQMSEEHVYRTPPRVIRRVKREEFWVESQAVMSYPPLCCDATTSRVHQHSEDSTYCSPRLPLKRELPMVLSEERAILEETEHSGHFLYGDEIDRIYEVFTVHD